MRIRSLFPPLAAIPTLVALAASGCSSEPASERLDGVWTSADDLLISISLTIQEDDGAVTGTASVRGGLEWYSGSVEGSYTHPDCTIAITIVVEGETNTITWAGTRTDDDTLVGVATGGGDVVPLTFRRETESS